MIELFLLYYYAIGLFFSIVGLTITLYYAIVKKAIDIEPDVYKYIYIAVPIAILVFSSTWPYWLFFRKKVS